jgi:hypothetical protein
MMPGILRRLCAVAAALFACAPVALLAGANCDGAEAQPLPDTHAFLEEARRNLRSDRLLLEQYTFTEKRTEKRLDGNGAVKKTKTDTFEVYPSAEPGKMSRRRIARDGVPLSAKELAEEDRKQADRVEKSERKLAGEDAAARAARLGKDEEDLREEQRVITELYQMDDLVLEGREWIDGRPTIVIAFTPRPGYKPVTEGGKVLQKLAGRAWIDEEDKQLARVEARLIDNLGVGPARVARLQKGATSYFYRRKVNDEIWLPAEARFTGSAKVLLFFGGGVDALFEYGDYKKFSVSAEATITEP